MLRKISKHLKASISFDLLYERLVTYQEGLSRTELDI
jgi:hypothetical protein